MINKSACSENHTIFGLLILAVLSSFLIRCSPPKTDKSLFWVDSTSFKINYAHGFKVTHTKTYKLVEVTYPYPGATSGYRYMLVQRGQPVPAHDDQTEVITIPLERIVCTSTTHIPLLDYLNETNSLIGFPTTDYISSAKMRQRIDSGKVTDLGIDKGMNLELLVTLRPSLVMGYTMNNDLGQLKKVRELGIPIVVNAEYLEKHPLGRAEWIKFMALFFNKERQADSVFRIIESSYNHTRDLAKNTTAHSTAMSGIVYGDTWYLPGGQNYAARLLYDAGYTYLWKQDSTSGFLELSFESVFSTAKDADFWIGVGSFKSLAEIKAAEERYTRFKPFQTASVYTFNARLGVKGGSEFLELGYLRPDFILNDLVKIAHPELLPSHELYFHKKLE